MKKILILKQSKFIDWYLFQKRTLVLLIRISLICCRNEDTIWVSLGFLKIKLGNSKTALNSCAFLTEISLTAPLMRASFIISYFCLLQVNAKWAKFFWKISNHSDKLRNMLGYGLDYTGKTVTNFTINYMEII